MLLNNCFNFQLQLLLPFLNIELQAFSIGLCEYNHSVFLLLSHGSLNVDAGQHAKILVLISTDSAWVCVFPNTVILFHCLFIPQCVNIFYALCAIKLEMCSMVALTICPIKNSSSQGILS